MTGKQSLSAKGRGDSSSRWSAPPLSTAVAVVTVCALAILVYNLADSQTAAPQQPDHSSQEASTRMIDGDRNSVSSTKQQKGESGLDSRRAFGYLVKICSIGPRISGSRGMTRQQRLIADHFTELGAAVRFQSFDVAHPLSGRPVRMNNIIVSWDPNAEKRVLLCCHYDTRPFPDRDPVNPRGRFIGANDGASGVALLMELGHHMPDLDSTYGVDFVFFDGEELVYTERDKYFLGSEHFAEQYRDDPPDHRYVYGVLVDMIGDRNLNIYKEKNSVDYAPRLVDGIWATAERLNVREFIDREKYEIRDDHIPLNEIARIPTCDIIDFDYGPRSRPYWHTTQDLPVNCSGASLTKVGRVLLEWLKSVPREN